MPETPEERLFRDLRGQEPYARLIDPTRDPPEIKVIREDGRNGEPDALSLSQMITGDLELVVVSRPMARQLVDVLQRWLREAS